MERLKISNVSISNSNIKFPIGKSSFAVNLPLKLIRASIANADIGNLNSLHTFLKNCLYHMLLKFEENCIVETARNFEAFDKKKKKKTKKIIIFDKELLPFWKTFL